MAQIVGFVEHDQRLPGERGAAGGRLAGGSLRLVIGAGGCDVVLRRRAIGAGGYDIMGGRPWGGKVPESKVSLAVPRQQHPPRCTLATACTLGIARRSDGIRTELLEELLAVTSLAGLVITVLPNSLVSNNGSFVFNGISLAGQSSSTRCAASATGGAHLEAPDRSAVSFSDRPASDACSCSASLRPQSAAPCHASSTLQVTGSKGVPGERRWS
ncbi:hypothetical protein E2C01_063794 [Portunus trituberculatus]|uniref:Uncharacterized protein n=1 Tax=Portunus trituberculatus TaxID=210409 RepID=A0A5B7HM06_PORTR|nr:hypothetical protein [Portunus trituberculatus]